MKCYNLVNEDLWEWYLTIGTEELRIPQFFCTKNAQFCETERMWINGAYIGILTNP
ncbi:hypothetical protein L3107_pA0034 (plasmid) [Lactococcus cremoris]|nr:hypothetical protein L3107_pA0034 [Lactococcus cremoris]